MKRSKKSQSPPTLEQYGSLQEAYRYFNKTLFDNTLGPCMLTLAKHGKSTLGLFHAEQWSDRDASNVLHEISLSPYHLARDLVDVFGTLVHEMCHLWQQDHGTPSRNGYHNKEWGEKMKEVGLYPSNTGKPGGKETGQQMTHYLIEGGPFLKAFEAMPDDVRLPWVGVACPEAKKKGVPKTKYACPACEAACWGKPDLLIVCGDCDEEFEVVPPKK